MFVPLDRSAPDCEPLVGAIVGCALAIFLSVDGQPVNAQVVHTVNLLGTQFTPQDLSVDAGDTVRWVWQDGPHNVESGTLDGFVPLPDGNFRSGDPVFPPTAFELTFDLAFLQGHPMPDDVYPYYCIAHVPLMFGTVTVRRGACVVDADCTDQDPCTADVCNQGECRHDVVAGCCTSGAACDDANACTDDACVGGQCQFVPNSRDCDDGNTCTRNDTCRQGACRGDFMTGCCRVDADCTTEDPCTATACVDGTCVATPVPGCCAADADCDDGNSCTLDRCVGNACIHDPSDDPCDDQDACTAGDACLAGACAGTPIADCVPCFVPSDCDDTDPCTKDQCVDGRCVGSTLPECLDDDADGVADLEDACPQTPADEPADASGCSESQRDSDGDGVADARDACPDSPAGEGVDESGCTVPPPVPVDDMPGDDASEDEDDVARPAPRFSLCGALGFVGLFSLFAGWWGLRLGHAAARRVGHRGATIARRLRC